MRGVTLDAKHIEDKLRSQLRKDSRKPSRVTREGDTIWLRPSGTACGLAIALETRSGEHYDHILDRLIGEL